MRRWVEQFSHWKWFRPGMGVKRWLALLLVGLIMLVWAVTVLPRTIELSGLWRLLQRLHLQQISPVLQVAVLAAVGVGLVAWAILGLNRSLLSAFRHSSHTEVADVIYRHRQRQRGPKIVAIGGGHGLNTLLRGLKEYTDNITAVVTVADDGGSSGRLRRDLGMLPPGDFRNCMAALSDDEGLLSQLFQYRFGGDTDLDGHSFGNLYLTAMTAITGSFEGALEESSKVLAMRGHVVPSTLTQVTLAAEVLSHAGRADRVETVRGESNVGATGGRIQRVYLEPENPPAHPQAIRAILDADLIAIGPGSLYTSVLPNLLVPDLAQAVAGAQAVKVYICNVATQAGETAGYHLTDHVDALRDHVGRELFSTVLANHTFTGQRPPGAGVDWVGLPRPQSVDYRLVTRDLVDAQYPWRHDPAKLAQALLEIMAS